MRSPEADALAWTALRDGGNRGRVEDTVLNLCIRCARCEGEGRVTPLVVGEGVLWGESRDAFTTGRPQP